MERADGAKITYDFIRRARPAPLVGRSFLPDEDRPNGAPVVTISEALWRPSFDARAVGRSVGRCGPIAHRARLSASSPRARDFRLSRHRVGAAAGRSVAAQSELHLDGHRAAQAGRHRGRSRRDLLRTQQPIWDTGDKERDRHPLRADMRARSHPRLQHHRVPLGAAVGAPVHRRVCQCRQRHAGAGARTGGARWAFAWPRRQPDPPAPAAARRNVLLSVGGGAAGLAMGRGRSSCSIRAAGDQAPRGPLRPRWA